MTDKEKEATIHKVYHDPAGYGSINNTLRDAQAIDKTIKIHHVKEFFKNNVQQKVGYKGQNSFVAPEPHYEYQMDILFIKYLENQKHTAALLCIDDFTKYCAIVPIESRTVEGLSAPFIECLHKMGKMPKNIYADGETSLGAPLFEKYYKEHNITFIPTRTHPYFAERMILTFKTMLDKRLENEKDKTVQWTDYIYPILLTYNHKLVHSATGFTPEEAKKPDNFLNSYINMKMKAKHNRIYPEIKTGDNVKIYRKRKPNEKANVSLWSAESHPVEDITETNGMKFYKTTGRDRPFLRHEILKVS